MSKCWSFLLFLALSRMVFASTEYVPLQERAEGRSLVGSSLLNDSLYSNPASGAFTSVYSLDGTYLSSKTFDVSVFDTKTSEIGGGLGYYREQVPGSEDARQGARLALLGRASSTIGLGVAGKMMWGPGIDGANTHLNDVDTGIFANFGWSQLGLSLRNIFGGSDKYDQFREYSLGGSVNYSQTLFLSMAATSKWGYAKPYEYGIGVAYVSPYYFALKGGYRIQPELHLTNWSAGASFISPKVAFHYAVEFPAIAGDSPVHTLGATLQF